MINRELNYSPNKEKKLIVDNESWAKLRGEYLFFEDAKKYLVMEDAPIAVDQMSGLLKKIQKFKNENFKGIARPLVAEGMFLVDDEGVKKDVVLISYNYLTTLKKDVETIKKVIYENNSLNQSQKNKLQDKCSRMLNKIDFELGEYKKDGVEIDKEEINREKDNDQDKNENILLESIKTENITSNEAELLISQFIFHDNTTSIEEINRKLKKTIKLLCNQRGLDRVKIDFKEKKDKTEINSEKVQMIENIFSEIEEERKFRPKVETNFSPIKVDDEGDGLKGVVGKGENDGESIEGVKNADLKSEDEVVSADDADSEDSENFLEIKEIKLKEINKDNAKELINAFYRSGEEFNDETDEGIEEKIEKATLALLEEVNLNNEGELEDLENAIIKKEGSGEKIELIVSIIQKYKESKEKDSETDDSTDGNSRSDVAVENLNNKEKDGENEQANVKSEELIEEIKKKQKELEKSNEEIKELKTELEGLSKELNEIRGEKENSVEELKQKNENLNEKIEELKKIIEEKEKELNGKNQERGERIKQLEKEIEEIKEEEENKEKELRKNIEDQTEKINKLNKKLDEKESRKNELSSEIIALNNEIKSFKDNLEKKDGDLIKIEEEKKDLQLNIEKLKREKEGLNFRIETLEKKTENTNELRDKVEKLQNINNEISEENNKLVEKKGKLKKSLDEKDEEIEIKKSKISELEKGVENYIKLEKEVNDLIEEKKGLESGVKEWRVNYTNEVEEKGKLESQVKQLKENINSLEQKLKDYVLLEKDFQLIREDREKTEKDVKDLQDKIDNLKKNEGDLGKEINKLKENLSSEKNAKNEVSQKLKETQKEMEALSGDLEKKEKDNRGLIEENQNLREGFEKNQKKIEERIEKIKDDYQKQLEAISSISPEDEGFEVIVKKYSNLIEEQKKYEEEIKNQKIIIEKYEKEKEKERKEEKENKKKIESAKDWAQLYKIIEEISPLQLRRRKKWIFSDFKEKFLDNYRSFGKFKHIYTKENLYIKEILEKMKELGSEKSETSWGNDEKTRELFAEKEGLFEAPKFLSIGFFVKNFLELEKKHEKDIDLLKGYKRFGYKLDLVKSVNEVEENNFKLQTTLESIIAKIKDCNYLDSQQKESALIEIEAKKRKLQSFSLAIETIKKYLENKNN